LKRSDNLDFAAILDPADAEPCPECSAEPGKAHASWCLFEADGAEDDYDTAN